MYKEAANQKLVNKPTAQIELEVSSATLNLTGAWLWSTINEKFFYQQLDIINTIEFPQAISINAVDLQQVDTTGIYFINRLISTLKEHRITITNLRLSQVAQRLFNTLEPQENMVPTPTIAVTSSSLLEGIGHQTVEFLHAGSDLLSFFGHFCVSFIRAFGSPASFNYAEMMRSINDAGLKGLWVSVLLSFLIGVTLAYQISPQFVTYGANIYIVNFLGISLLKEVSPLLTAIIVAGRTGAAITAEIGTQKMQEEIDALQTMGISPMKRIVLPKVIGVMIAVPLITAIADIASMLGGAIVAKSNLSVTYTMFIERLQSQVSVNNYSCGIIKSVFFAYLIALVGCFCGFKVTNNANSIGTQTTKSVVMGIILIVFVDAIFAIIFKVLGV